MNDKKERGKKADVPENGDSEEFMLFLMEQEKNVLQTDDKCSFVKKKPLVTQRPDFLARAQPTLW